MASAETLQYGGRGFEPFAKVGHYFDALPDGWASFPRCLARGSLIGSRRTSGALEALEGLPGRLQPRVLIDSVTSGAEWLPEVVHVATLLAMRDARFDEGPGGDDDFQRWIAQLNGAILDEPDNARLVGGGSADFLSRFALILDRFHVGTPSTVVAHSANRARLTIAHPAPLFPALTIEIRRRSIENSLAKQGAVQPQVTALTEVSGADAQTLFDATWA